MSSDMNQSLTVEILGDATSAVEATNVSQLSIDKLTTAITDLTAKFDVASVSGDKLTASHERGSAVTDLYASHTLQLARGMDALDLSMAGAATRAAGMADVMGRMTLATPGLLAMGAALTAAMAGLTFFREGIDEATAFQNSMRELQIMASSSGVAFVGMEQRVGEWATALAEASGIVESVSVPAVLKLVDAGQSVSGAMTEVTIAAQMVAAGMGIMRGSADEAASAHQRFMMILRALLAVQDGNYTMIQRIDPAVRKLVEAHAPWPVILAAINEQTKNSIAANNTNAMSWERVHGILSVLAKDIGTELLPALETTARYLYGLAASAGNLGHIFGDWASNSIQAIANVIVALEHFGHAMLDLMNANWKGLAEQGSLAWRHVGAAAGNVGNVIGDMEKTFTTFFGASSAGAAHLTTELSKLHDQASDTASVLDPGYKSKTKSGPGAGAVPGAADYETENLTNQTRLQNAAEKDLAATSAALETLKARQAQTEANLAAAVKDATTEQQKANAQTTLDNQKTSDANALIGALSAAIDQEKQHRDALTATVANAKNTLEADLTVQHQHSEALAGAHKEALRTREATSQYSAAVHDATERLRDAEAALTKYNAALKQHQTELDAAKVKQIDDAAAQGAAIADLSRKWDDFTTKAAAEAADSAAKQRMSGEQLFEYYRQEYERDYEAFVKYKTAGLQWLASVYEQQAEQAYRNMNQEQNALYQQDYNNRKQWLDKAASELDTFINAAIQGHKKLKDELKSIYDQILEAFIQMCIKMMLESSIVQTFLKNAFGGFFGGGAGAALPGLGGSGAGAFGGNIGQGVGAASVGSASSSFGSSAVGSAGYSGIGARGAGAALPLALAGASVLGGGGGAINPADFSSLGAGMGGAGSSVAPVGATMLSGAGRGGLGGALGAGMLGGVLGNMVSHMAFGGKGDSLIGGALGGAAGGILGSLLASGMLIPALSLTGPIAPIAIALMALVGGLAGGGIGSLFGNHFNPASEPDINQTQQWGQELADLQGSTAGSPMMANGQAFTMDSWTQSNTQGKGWNILFESFVQMFRNNQKVLPGELRGGFANIAELWGGAQNEADFNSNGKNGMLQLGSGKMAQWTEFWGNVSAYGPAIAQLMSQFTATDLYSASINGSVSELGGYTPGGDPWMIHNFPDAGSPMSGPDYSAPPSVIGGAGSSKKTLATINVYQSFGGSIIADNALDRRIFQAIERIPGFSAADMGAAAQ